MRHINSIFAIAKYTMIEQIRNRLYLIIFFFTATVMGLSILLGSLAPGQKVRVIFDFGLVTLETFGLIASIFGAVTLVLQEIESKTIYLLLTRPLGRSVYIVGRFSGLMVAIAFTVVAMAIFHVAVMMIDFQAFKIFIEGWNFQMIYPLFIIMALGKILVITSVAVFFSLFATSSVSALVFTVFFWIAGHFGVELAFMIKKAFAGTMQHIVSWISYLLPNFHYFNFRDTFQIPQFPGLHFLQWSLLYGITYASFFLGLSVILFKRKEF